MRFLAKKLLEDSKIIEKKSNLDFDKAFGYLSNCSIDINVLERETYLIFNIARLDKNYNIIYGKTINLLNSISRTLSGNLVDDSKLYIIKPNNEYLFGQTYEVIEKDVEMGLFEKSFDIQKVAITVKLEKATFSSW